MGKASKCVKNGDGVVVVGVNENFSCCRGTEGVCYIMNSRQNTESFEVEDVFVSSSFRCG